MKLILIGIIFLCSPLLVSAQSFDTDFPAPYISLTPSRPQPVTEVAVSLTPTSDTLEQSPIQWYRNNVLFAEGVGLISATTTSPRVGEEVIVRAMIDSNPPRVASFSLQSGTVSLQWSASTYTPPFYKGRALPTRTSSITAEALPELYRGTKKISAADLYFTWSVNGSVIQKASGKSRAQAQFVAPFEGILTIGVVVATKDGAVTAEAKETLSPVEVQMQLYRTHPLFGTLFQNPIPSEYVTNETDLEFTAVPFFASTKRAQSLSFEWNINDAPASINKDFPHRVHITSAGPGRALLSVTLSNALRTLEHLSREWTLYLGEKTIPSLL